MYLLGHLGIGLGLAWLLAWKTRLPVDYRLVLLGTILPDLVDKPLGLLLGLEARLWAHTLVFVGAILGVSLVPSLRGLVYLGLGVATHLLLDEIWQQPWVVLWPAFGFAFPPGITDLLSRLLVLFSDPVVIAGEIAGTLVLLAFARVHGINSWRALVQFLRTGASRATSSI